jgi:hypothetical protein
MLRKYQSANSDNTNNNPSYSNFPSAPTAQRIPKEVQITLAILDSCILISMYGETMLPPAILESLARVGYT